jgi:hypothetical protein
MKKIIIIFAVLAIIKSENAKGQAVGEFGYNVSFPVGDFNNFISKTSWVGFNVGGRGYLNSNKRISLGGSFEWFYFPDKRGNETVDLKDQGVFTGNVTNYTNIYGLTFVAQYDLKDRKERMVPFLRAEVGGAYQNQRQDIGLYSFKNDGIQFEVNGQAGVSFSNDGRRAVSLAVTYHYLPAASDMVSTSFFGIKLGFTNSKF